MVDAASGGALIDKTPEEAQHLISTMAEIIGSMDITLRGVFPWLTRTKARSNSLWDMLKSWTSNRRMPLTTRRNHAERECRRRIPGQPQRRYDPHSNFYNPGWRDHPNFSYRNPGEQSNPTHRSSTDLHLLKLHLKHRIQLATSFSQLAAQSSGKLPSQTESNPRENVSAMTLRSGKELQPVEPTSTKAKEGGKSLEHADSHTDKELCTNKRKLKDKERIIFGKNVSAVINPLNLSTLQDTNVIIQLADHSYVRPMGLVEDVLVKVNDLLFPVDFYILKMETEGLNNPASILLGRPFMKTAKTKIDVDDVVHDVLEEELVGTELDLIMDLDEDDECVEFIGGVLEPSQSF
ncbi:UNVERIFIED_CONTAM: hypothetical protein Slati_3720900, partial [Sesamum latifolium]